jgi:hypothetical protein
MTRIQTNPVKPTEYHIHLPSDDNNSPDKHSAPKISKRKSLTAISKTGSENKPATANFTVALSRSTSPRGTQQPIVTTDRNRESLPSL